MSVVEKRRYRERKKDIRNFEVNASYEEKECMH